MKKPSVLISILNWNNAPDTIKCVASLRKTISHETANVDIRVIDNGSWQEDYVELCRDAEAERFSVTRLDENLGFTGGHNISIDQAIKEEFAYIWMLNNDATVETGCIEKLVAEMEGDRGLGAVSPVIRPKGGGHSHAAWGGIHVWETRETRWFHSEADSIAAHVTRPTEVFVAGTAILIRVEALRQIGKLDDRLFAYYDDSDLAVRLEQANWRSKVVFDAFVSHGWRPSEQLPDYFFYLSVRNSMIFLHTHTPREHRKFFWLKLVDNAIYDACRLSVRGLHSQSRAALLGIWDFMFCNYGRPNLERKVPLSLRMAYGASGLLYKAKLAQYLRSTGAASQ